MTDLNEVLAKLAARGHSLKASKLPGMSESTRLPRGVIRRRVRVQVITSSTRPGDVIVCLLTLNDHHVYTFALCNDDRLELQRGYSTRARARAIPTHHHRGVSSGAAAAVGEAGGGVERHQAAPSGAPPGREALLRAAVARPRLGGGSCRPCRGKIHAAGAADA